MKSKTFFLVSQVLSFSFLKQTSKNVVDTTVKEKSLLYLRYIANMFMIWKGTKAELMAFIKELNKKQKTIKFDVQISPRKIAFLGVMLYIDKNNNIQTTLYRKATDQQASEHPRSLKSSIPYSQALSLKNFAPELQNLIRIVLSINRGF